MRDARIPDEVNDVPSDPSRPAVRSVRRRCVVWILAVTLCAALPACAWFRAEPEPIRVMTYNIRHAQGTDGVVDLARVAAVIQAQAPDVVALQEVDQGCARSGGDDQARRLAELCGMQARFSSFMSYDGGRYGMAVLSRLPIVESRELRLPPGPEPRTALVVTVETPQGRELVVVDLHLWATDAQRLAQAEAVVAALADETRPTVVAGDLNGMPGGAVLTELERLFEWVPKSGPARTWPADGPEHEIDHVLLRPPSAFEAPVARVLDQRVASDHRPVVLDATLDG